MNRAADFAALDPDLPLALLPVRLEARFWPFDSGDAATELWVRIIPDLIHVDSHIPELTEREQMLGRRYWTRIWPVVDDETELESARRWLADRVGPFRSLWVAGATTPTNHRDAPDGQPTFPELELRTGPRPAVGRLLPSQWRIEVYVSHELAGGWWTRPVHPDLPMAPALADVDLGPDPDVSSLLEGQGLDWLTDFEAAVRVGMALKIPIDELPDGTTVVGISELICVGVRADGADVGDELDAAMEAHWYSRGLDLVPQGTPTNNSGEARTGVSFAEPDVRRLFELEESAPVIVARPLLTQPDRLVRTTAGHAASLALGRIRANVFDRVEHTDDATGELARAMNTALWPPTWGRFLADPAAPGDGPVIDGDGTGWLRSWYQSWVRGGAPLPTLRIGPQPYGLLPITPTADSLSPRTTDREHLEGYLADLEKDWLRSTYAVAQLDPDATDAVPGEDAGEDATIIAEALAATPHPGAFRLRTVIDNFDDDNERFDDLLAAIGLFSMMIADPETGLLYDPLDSNPYYSTFLTYEERIRDTSSVEIQVFEAGQLAAVLHSAEVPDEPYNAGTLAYRRTADELIPLLDDHQARVDIARYPVLVDGHGTALGHPGLVRLYCATVEEDTTPVDHLIDDDIATAAVWLDELAVAADGIATGDRPDYPVGEAVPLLRQLLQQSVNGVGSDFSNEVGWGIRQLADHAAAGGITAADDLVRLMRETLGLSTHRLDAWITSLATERLAAKRVGWKAGVQLGGYGWLLDLEPTPGPPASGFVHAPSMASAAAAAVLRSGWAAYAGEGGEAPLAVDLSSGRVRAARWIVEAVAAGQDLARVLGARFERRLHDAGLDRYIDDVRGAVRAVTGSNGRGRGSVVDGLVLARAFSTVSTTRKEDRVRKRVEELDGYPDIAGVLGRLAGDLDSVADLVLAQSVNALLEGNQAEASATLALTGSGDAAIPEIRVADTNRDAVVVDHRLVAMLEPAPVGPGILAAAAPDLDGWVGRLLGPLSRVRCPHDGDQLDLATIGLSPLDIVRLCRPGPTQAGGLLEAVLRSAAGGPVDLGGGPGGDKLAVDEVTVEELGLLGAAVGELIGRSRALGPADLVPAGAEPPETVHGDDLPARYDAVVGLLQDAVPVLAGADLAARAATLRQLAPLGLAGLAPALADPSDEPAVEVVASALSDRLEAGPETVDGLSTGEVVAELQRLIGHRLPIPTRFEVTVEPSFVTDGASVPVDRSVEEHGFGWLRRVAKTRSTVERLLDVTLLSEATTRTGPVVELAARQLPDQAAGWVAVAHPDGEQATTSLVSVTGAAELDGGSAVSGLVIDTWAERIPRPTTLTGIAVHHDSPSARPPQAILLATMADDDEFTLRAVFDLVRETIELAKERAVGPDTLADHGQYAPAVFLEAGTVIGEPAG